MVIDAHLRRCVAGDEAKLCLVGQATFLETFAGILVGEDIVAHCTQAHAIEFYRSWVSDSTYALWLAECNPGNAPVGYMVLAPPQLPLPDTAGDIELKRVYLLDKFRGGGLGKRLVSAAITHCVNAGANRLLLGVYARNDAAIGFYERLGFRKLGTRKFIVGGKGYDDNIMGLSLNT